MKEEAPQLLCFNGEHEKLAKLFSVSEGKEGKEGNKVILSKDTEGRVALHYAVYNAGAGNLKCAELLLESGLTQEVMLNHRDNSGLSPLHIAAFRFFL